MNFVLSRFSDNGKSSLGLLHNKETKEFFAFALEDEKREVKVKGETRIPAGTYELKIRKDETPLTLKHRAAYGPWFKYHIEITGVPGFSGIYVHAGNDELHTDGCLLIGDSLANHFVVFKNQLLSSMTAVQRFYSLVYPHLEMGLYAFITIRDENFLNL